MNMIECFAGNKVSIPDTMQVIEGNRCVDKDWGSFRVLTVNDGDKRLIWCRRILEEVRAARNMFMDLLKSGMVPYRVGVNGSATSEVMDEFDPTAEEVIFLPMKAVIGG